MSITRDISEQTLFIVFSIILTGLLYKKYQLFFLSIYVS